MSGMRAMEIRSLIRFWLPVLVWMAVIFVGSTDLLSTQRTSRFIGPLLRWFKPDISNEMIKRVQTIVRKGGHVAEYAVLAVLCWRAIGACSGAKQTDWSTRRAVLAVCSASIYAVTDEWHQSLVSTRLGSGWDVLIDTAGAAAGLIFVWTWGRLRDYW